MHEKTDRTASVPTAQETGRETRSLSSVMTRNPECVTENEGLERVARLMVDCDCGAIPVVGDDNRLRGMVTDRDIVIRCVAQGKNPLEAKVRDAMTSNVWSARENESIERVTQIMKERQVRRVPIVNDNQEVIGIVAQADVANTGRDREVGETVERISEPEHRERAR